MVDFSYYIYHDDFTFISQSPGLRKSTLVLASPFEPMVWLSIVVSYFVISWTIYLISQINANTRESYVLIHIKMFAIYLNNSKCFLGGFAEIKCFVNLIFLSWKCYLERISPSCPINVWSMGAGCTDICQLLQLNTLLKTNHSWVSKANRYYRWFVRCCQARSSYGGSQKVFSNLDFYHDHWHRG